MVAAVRPVVAVLLGIMAYDFYIKTNKGLGKVFGIALILLSFLIITVFQVHPAITIILFITYGMFHIRISNLLKRKWGRKMDKDSEKLS